MAQKVLKIYELYTSFKKELHLSAFFNNVVCQLNAITLLHKCGVVLETNKGVTYQISVIRPPGTKNDMVI